MKTLWVFLLVLACAATGQAQTYTVTSVVDIPLSGDDARCGKYFILTNNTPAGPSVMFRYAAPNKPDRLMVVALERVTLSVDEATTVPSVSFASGPDNETGRIEIRMGGKDAKKAAKCFPPPATTSPSSPSP